MSYKQLIVLSSDNKTYGASHDFTIQLDKPMNFGFADFYISVLKIDTWNSAPNISTERATQTFTYSNGVDTRTLVIPQGIYTVDDLRAVIKSYMFSVGDYTGTDDAPSYDIELTPNYNTGKFTFTITGGYSIDWTTSNLYRLFGTVSAVKSASYEAENVGDITDGLNNIQIHLSLCSGSSLLGGRLSDVVQTYVPSSPPGAPLNIENRVKAPVKITSSMAQTIRVYLTDNKNRSVDLRGEPFSMTCLIEQSS